MTNNVIEKPIKRLCSRKTLRFMVKNRKLEHVDIFAAFSSHQRR